METIKFTKGNWEDKLDYAYTTRLAYIPKLIQEEKCVRNSIDERSFDGYDYTTVITKKMYGKDSLFTLECEFDNFGAPLFTFTDKIWRDENGIIRYSDCFEVVLWEKGINVWKLYEEEKKIKALNLFSSEFSVKAKEIHSMQFKILEKRIDIYVGGRKYSLYISDLPSEMYVGVTACEAINHLYSFSIE